MIKQLFALTVTAIVLTAAQTTFAAIAIDGAGQVTNWGVTPFSMTNGSGQLPSGIAYNIENDYSTINYPNGVGHNPSGGEAFDIEEIYIRQNSGRLETLVVASHTQKLVAGTTYLLGDLFMNVNGAQFAVVTQSASQGLAAGDIYTIADVSTDTAVLQPGSRSYLGNSTIEAAAGPWTVDGNINPAQKSDKFTADLDFVTFDYGGKEDNTVLIEYSIDIEALGVLDFDAIHDLDLHLTWGCGNDVINMNYQNSTTDIPLPATLPLGMAGLALVGITRRRMSRV